MNAKMALVVDNDAKDRALLATALRELEFTCDEAADGRAAYARLSTRRYDLAVLDIDLPYLSGHDVILRVRRTQPRLPIIAVSAFFSSASSDFPNVSSTLMRTVPDPLPATWANAPCSPWRSARKSSDPIGRFRIAERLMISVAAAATVGNCFEIRCMSSILSCSILIPR